MSAVLAMTDKRSILFQILFAVFDSLQGFVIVMVHCILRREVRPRTGKTGRGQTFILIVSPGLQPSYEIDMNISSSSSVLDAENRNFSHSEGAN